MKAATLTHKQQAPGTASDLIQGDGNSHSGDGDNHCSPIVLDQLLHELNPTDRGHFPENITGDNELLLKTFIVGHGSCRPPGPFPRVVNPGRQYKRSFSETHYRTQNKAGVEIPVLLFCVIPQN